MNAQTSPLPAEITSSAIWVCHKNKQPINPKSRYGAKSNDPSTWATYQEALDAQRMYNLDGIGIQFGLKASDNFGLSGIDLDHVVRADGSLEPFAEEIVQSMNSYTEYSPSGTGLHILCYTNTDDIGNRTKVAEIYTLEMYNHRRFFTYTGKVFREYSTIEQRTEAYKAIHNQYFPKPQTQSQTTLQPSRTIPFENPYSIIQREIAEEQVLLDKMFRSNNGDKIKKLFNGDISGYPSHSEADLALLSYLLFWTNRNVDKTCALFAKSGLMRDKWNNQEYRNRTLRQALDGLTSTYDPHYAADVPSKAVECTASEDLPLAETNGEDITQYLNDSLENDTNRFAKYKDRKTGFANLDEQTNLYPGLYVLGAISSLGKTTFACQLADQLAVAGEHVLYFSLEQSKFELITKGLSRLTAKSDISTAVTAMRIREGVRTPAVLQAIEKYKSFGRNIVIYQCGFDTTIRTIIDCVDNYIKEHDVLPVVIVDYLQIIRPINAAHNTKDVIDDHLRAFKKLQVEHDLVLLLISSLNRSNYLTPVDFESFKESGGIEYTADVIWGLQLSVMNNDEVFDKEKGLKAKREAVRQAKSQLPREVDLVCLKNRHGKPTYTCKFNYYAQFDYFDTARSNIFCYEDCALNERQRKAY